MTASVARNKNPSFLYPWASLTNGPSISRTSQTCGMDFDGFSSALRFSESRDFSSNDESLSTSKHLECHVIDSFNSSRRKEFRKEPDVLRYVGSSSGKNESFDKKTDQASTPTHWDHQEAPETPNQERKNSPENSCPGLFDYIRRKKTLKQYRCSRCALTHSNFVRANKPSNCNGSFSRLRASRSHSTTTNNKVIIICQNCGKRSYTQSAFSRQAPDFSDLRSMTWPLPLERIAEDDLEDPKAESNVSYKLKQRTSEIVSNDVPGFGVDSTVIKVLIGGRNDNILPAIQGLNRWSIGRAIHFYFLALKTSNYSKLNSKLGDVIDGYIDVIENNDILVEEQMLVEAAESNNIKVVLVDDVASGGNHSLVNKLKKAGFYVLQPDQSSRNRDKLNELAIVVPETNDQNSLFIRILSPTLYGLSPSTCDEKPAGSRERVHDALLFTAVHLAYSRHQNREDAYKSALRRGEVLLPGHFTSSDQIEIFYGTTKYDITATRVAPTTFHLNVKAGRTVLVHIVRSSACGSTMTYNSVLHDSVFEELVNSYRITVDQKVFVFGKQNSCNSYNVWSKISSESEVRSRNIPNSVLVACNSTEDPNDTIPPAPDTTTRQSNTILQSARDRLSHVMRGWGTVEEFFEEDTVKTVDEMMTALNDPSLPLHELQEVMVGVSGKLSPPVEQRICREMSRYSSNITSMMSQFPADKILHTLDCYAARLTSESEKLSFKKMSEPISCVVQRYRRGIRGCLELETSSLLRMYYQIESKFQRDSFTSCVHKMMKEGEDLDQIVQNVLSHSQLMQKNFLVLQLLKRLSVCHNKYSDDVISVLEDVCGLLDEGTVRIALESRRILRKCRKAPYEIRYNQLSSIFLSMTTRGGEMMDSFSESDVFETVPQFFSHSNVEVQMASLEMFIRRIYSQYELTSVQHRPLSSHHPALIFQFAPLQPGFDSTLAPSPVSDCGLSVFAAFPDLQSFDRNFMTTIQLFDDPRAVSADFCDLSDLTLSVQGIKSTSTKPSRVVRSLNVAIVTPDDVSDDILSDRLLEVLRDYKDQVNKAEIELVTFTAYRVNEVAKFYTFRSTSNEFSEDYLLRHIHPALFTQLGFDISACHALKVIPSSKHHLHLFRSCDKDQRILIRTLVRDLNGNDRKPTESLLDEVEFLLLEVLDELEILSSDHQTQSSLFINLLPSMSWNRNEIEDAMRILLNHFKEKMWRKKLNELKIKFHIRSEDTDDDSFVTSVDISSVTDFSVCTR